MKCGKYRLYAYNVDYMHIPYNYIPHDDHLHTHTHTGMHTDRHTDTQTHTHTPALFDPGYRDVS